MEHRVHANAFGTYAKVSSALHQDICTQHTTLGKAIYGKASVWKCGRRQMDGRESAILCFLPGDNDTRNELELSSRAWSIYQICTTNSRMLTIQWNGEPDDANPHVRAATQDVRRDTHSPFEPVTSRHQSYPGRHSQQMQIRSINHFPTKQEPAEQHRVNFREHTQYTPTWT